MPITGPMRKVLAYWSMRGRLSAAFVYNMATVDALQQVILLAGA